MRRALAFLVAATLLLLALVIKAPASLVDGRIEAMSAGKVRLASATGTLWNGAGELRLVDGNASLPVSWQIDAWPLLRGELRGTLAVEDGAAAPASFSLGLGESTVRNVSLNLPANTLLRVAGVPALLANAGGNVGLKIGELTKRGDRIEGHLALRWDQATLQTLQIVPRPSLVIALGDIRVDATGQGSDLAGPVANTGGDVEIGGTVSASLNGNARLDARVRPRAGMDVERANSLGNILALLGQPDGGGYRITFAQ
jgi:general secretion pathway protein N